MSSERAKGSCLRMARVCHGPGRFLWLQSCLPALPGTGERPLPVPMANAPRAESCGAPGYCWEREMLSNSQRVLSALQDPALSKVAAPSPTGSSPSSSSWDYRRRVTAGLAGWSSQRAGSGTRSLPCPLCLLLLIPLGFTASLGMGTAQ